MKKFRVLLDGRFIVFFGKNGGMYFFFVKVRLKISGFCIFFLSLVSWIEGFVLLIFFFYRFNGM